MSKTYISLGRLGDICSILPLMWSDAQHGTRNRLMVAAEYASLLDGVSYVEPVVYPGPHYEIAKAVELAKATNGSDWLCTQVNGPSDQVLEATYKPVGQQSAVCTSYQKEMWRVAGRLPEWDNGYPLVFDKRDPAREALLVARHMPKQVPYVLLSTGGNSSPFPHADLLREAVSFVCQNVIDLGQVKADRFYDLLGLYEKARLLVATDSAPLHLADAVPTLPVIALANDKPLLWNGSSWRPNHAAYCRYSDFPGRVVELMQVMKEPWAHPDKPCIIDIWNAYEKKVDRGQKGLRRRYGKHSSLFWPMPIELGACGRDSVLNLHDEKRVPFLRDCLRMALQRAKDEDYICLTRPDSEFNHGEVGNLAKLAPCFAYRLSVGPEQTTFVPVVDMFCAHRKWWTERLPEIPDLLFGGDHWWGQALWAIFTKHEAQNVTGMVYRQSDK